jgi:phosphate transport system substrate-binding protein
MQTINKNYFWLLLLVLCSLIYFSCDYGKVKSVTTIGQTTIGVDESESQVIKKEADEFMRLNPEAKIDQRIKTSNELMADLINGDIKTIIVDRDFTKEEQALLTKYNIDLKKNKFALDGVGVIVNPKNPLTKLNYNELRRIFTGETTDWKGMDGDNKDVYKGKIKVLIARGNASIHDFFKQKVFLANQDYSKYDMVCSTSTQMLREVQTDEKAIGFITMSWITRFADTLDTIVKPLRIAPVDSAGHVGDYVGLHQAYIAERTYPFVVETYIYSRDYDLNVSAGFISFLLSYDGQKIVLNSGLVPETQPVRIIQLN